MHFFLNESHTSRFFRRCMTAAALMVGLVLSACSQKPWLHPVDEPGRMDSLTVIDQMQQQQSLCLRCFDANLTLRYSSGLIRRGISGYLLLDRKGSLKLISSNPLGQPIFAFVSDGSLFQYINTFERYIMAGSVEDFVDHHQLPTDLLDLNPAALLTGQLPTDEAILEVRGDKENRGLWFTYQSPAGPDMGLQHLLIDIERHVLLRRLFTNSDGTDIFEVIYNQWTPKEQSSGCSSPAIITITGLDFGGEIVLKFSDIAQDGNCSDADFHLPQPAGFSSQPISAAGS